MAQGCRLIDPDRAYDKAVDPGLSVVIIPLIYARKNRIAGPLREPGYPAFHAQNRHFQRVIVPSQPVYLIITLPLFIMIIWSSI